MGGRPGPGRRRRLDPATADTLFRIGSVSKGFVSLSILKLQAEGRLNLQDTLRSRAPDLGVFDPWEATDPVRIVHLLGHNGGMGRPAALSEVALNRCARGASPLREGLKPPPADPDLPLEAGHALLVFERGAARGRPTSSRRSPESGLRSCVEKTWFKPLRMDTAKATSIPRR